jgi:Tfp pilus assembly PilM family ATPase
LVIPDRYVTVFHTVVPRSVFGSGSERSLQQTIERYLEKLLIDYPEFSETDMISDYEVLGETSQGYDIHVSVARPAQFKYIPELLEAAGFTVGHVDISSFALHKLAQYLNKESAYGTISIGSHSTHVSMVRDGKVIASSWCQVGSNDLIRVVEKTLKITRAEAERIIHQYGILHMHPDKEVLSELLLALRPVVESIGQVQVACSDAHYQHPFYHAPGDQFYLYGIGASISGIAQYLGIKANASVRTIDVIPTEFLDEEIIVQIPVEVLPLYLPVMSTAVNYLTE